MTQPCEGQVEGSTEEQCERRPWLDPGPDTPEKIFLLCGTCAEAREARPAHRAISQQCLLRPTTTTQRVPNTSPVHMYRECSGLQTC